MDIRYSLAFNLAPHIGPAKAQRLLDHFGDLETAWRANQFDLVAAGLDKRALENLLETRKKIDLDAELEKIQRAGVHLIVLDDPNYPRLLKQIPHAPFLLYVKGQIISDDEWSMAVVGTRRATAYGREATQSIVTDLVRNRVTIVSGLARGIDAEAHHTALDQRGRTIAVLGCGVNVVYPPEHKKTRAVDHRKRRAHQRISSWHVAGSRKFSTAQSHHQRAIDGHVDRRRR